MLSAKVVKQIAQLHRKHGMSIRSIARKIQISPTTVRKWLNADVSHGVRYQRAVAKRKIDAFVPWLEKALAEDLRRPIHEQRSAMTLFRELRKQGFGGSYSRLTSFVRTWRTRSGLDTPRLDAWDQQRLASKQKWMEWLYDLERNPIAASDGIPISVDLIKQLSPSPHSPRKRLLAVLARQKGFSIRSISLHLGISHTTTNGYLLDFDSTNGLQLFSPRQRARKSDDQRLKDAVFSLLHEPPSLSGYNRTTWRMIDLQEELKRRQFAVARSVIRTVIKKAGFRWKSARVVLTSNDPLYREKLEHVQAILANLKSDERFFSIDEFGPFAIKAKAGRALVKADVQPTAPQWQKSKGWLIATAALELSTNQVTHFYSRAKNTTEMIRMANTLVEQYKDARKLYLSWDAASWHMSKELLGFVEKHNNMCSGRLPTLELTPLPASAQFLNVIESVFSGMARAIIHSSDYPSVKAAQEAIDRYFVERNQHFKENPRRAGKKIWGLERSSSEFSGSNNCKDPDFR